MVRLVLRGSAENTTQVFQYPAHDSSFCIHCVLIITIRENNIKILFTDASQEEQSTLQFYAAKLSSNSFVFFAVKKMQKEILRARK